MDKSATKYEISIGGTNVLIVENEPTTDYPKAVLALDKPKYLQVHHKIYILDDGELVKPWEYKNEYLVTVCKE